MGYLLSLDRQHQVIENVLKSYLKDDALDSAILLWEKQYRGQPFEKLSFFVFEIATTSTLRHLRKNILQELEQKLTSQEVSEQVVEQIDFNAQKSAKLLQRPRYIPTTISMQNQEVVEIDEKIEVTAADVQAEAVIDIQALSEFVQMLKTMLSAVNQTELEQVLEEYLQDEPLPLFIKQEVLDVVLKNGAITLLPYDSDHIRQAINIIYSILCEYHGPVKTDRTMTRAISNVEQKYPLEDLRQFL